MAITSDGIGPARRFADRVALFPKSRETFSVSFHRRTDAPIGVYALHVNVRTKYVEPAGSKNLWNLHGWGS